MRILLWILTYDGCYNLGVLSEGRSSYRQLSVETRLYRLEVVIRLFIEYSTTFTEQTFSTIRFSVIFGQPYTVVCLITWLLLQNRGGGGGETYFSYILLNEIQTMFSQLAKQSHRKLSADCSIAHEHIRPVDLPVNTFSNGN